MAIRTISNTGGNYNSTATWGGLSIPTSADDVVSTATSGPLVVNVASAARSINLSTYTSTVTMNANWTLSVTAVTNTFGGSFAGTVGIMIISGATTTLAQVGTGRIPNLSIITTGTKTITGNIYCKNLTTTGGSNITINGGNINVSGNLGTPAAIAAGPQGSGRVILDGDGFVTFSTSGLTVEMNTTGTYSTYAQGLTLISISAAIPVSFKLTNGGINEFNVILSKSVTAVDNYILDLDRKVTGIYVSINYTAASIATTNINLLKNLQTDVFTVLSNDRINTGGTLVPTTINMLGRGLSASVLSLYPSYTSSSTSAVSYQLTSPKLKLNSDFEHYIGSLKLFGGYTSNSLISSITASVPSSIFLNSKITSQITNFDFTDINATNDEIVAINGTLLRTTNVTNIYPTGGASDSSFVFVN